MPKNTIKEVREIARSREERAPEFANQVRERNRVSNKSNVVDRKVTTTRRAEALATKEIVKPAKRRYVRPSMLPGIPDLPGYHMEYVRRDNQNKGDYANLRAHIRSGWEIVRASEIDDKFLPTIQLTGHGDCIGNEDTVLMKLPEDLWADRQSQINDKRDTVTRAVNSKNPHIDNAHPAMPVVVEENRQSTSSQQVRVRERAAHVASD